MVHGDHDNDDNGDDDGDDDDCVEEEEENADKLPFQVYFLISICTI